MADFKFDWEAAGFGDITMHDKVLVQREVLVMVPDEMRAVEHYFWGEVGSLVVSVKDEPGTMESRLANFRGGIDKVRLDCQDRIEASINRMFEVGLAKVLGQRSSGNTVH